MTGFDGIAERFARARIFQALQSDDVAGESFLDFFAVGGVHQVHAAGALFLVTRRVRERHALLELARVDAAERDRADVLEAHDLEGDHRQRLAVRRPAEDFLAGLRIDAGIGFAIERRRKEIDDGVEQRLHALVLERRTAHHRIEGARHRRLADELAQRVLVRLLAVEKCFECRIVHLDGGFDHARREIRRPCRRDRPGSRPRPSWRLCHRRPR